MPFAETPAVFLADFGVPCVANGRSFTGILDTPDDMLNAAGVNYLSTGYLLTMRTLDATAAGLLSGNTVTVNGVAYVARDVMLVDDGTFTHVNLSK